MSPLGFEGLVLHRAPAPRDPANRHGYLLSCALLRLILTISKQHGTNQQPGKTRITRTSSKNIMPVLDTGHLLAFTRDMPDTGRVWGGAKEEQRGKGGCELQAQIKEGRREGQEMASPHASSVKRFSFLLALCRGQPVQVAKPPLGGVHVVVTSGYVLHWTSFLCVDETGQILFSQ